MAEQRQPCAEVCPTDQKSELPREPWKAPDVTELPRLTELTLQTGSSIGGTGNTGSGGSTVF